jgi:hypothetical protein
LKRFERIVSITELVTGSMREEETEHREEKEAIRSTKAA